MRIEYGIGEMEHQTRGSNLDGETDADLVRIQLEGYGYQGIGGGLRLEANASDDDLFANTVGDDFSASVSEVFLYLAFRVDNGRLRFPIRTGLVFHELVLEDDLLDIDVEYFTWAFRFEGEPEYVLLPGESVRWSIYSLFGMGFGATEIESDPSTVDDDSGAFLLGFELGTRLQWGPALFGLGYVYRLADIDEGEDFYFGLSNEFSGVLLSLGIRF